MNFNVSPQPGVFSHSTPRPAYPAMKWHPVTGESIVVHSEKEVPDGYLDTHPSSAPAKVEAAPEPMTRKEIIAALKEGEIEFDPKADKTILYALLLAGLRATLEGLDVYFTPDATAPELLALLKA